MWIKTVHVKNFFSVKDSKEVELDKKITVLIGKNESGKTNFLKALEAFNSDYEYTEEDFCNYSDLREKLESEQVKPEDIEMVTVCFEIEKEDTKRLREIHKELAKIKHLEVTKYFNNAYSAKSPECKIEDLDVKDIRDELALIRNQVDLLKAKLDKHTQRLAPFASSQPQYNQCINLGLSAG